MRRFRVGQNGRERLVDFVRDGGGHFPGDRAPVHSRHLKRSLAGLHLRQVSTTALVQQPRNQQRLPD